MRTIEIQLYKYTELEKYTQEVAVKQLIDSDSEYYGQLTEADIIEILVDFDYAYEFYYTGKMYDDNSFDYLFEV